MSSGCMPEPVGDPPGTLASEYWRIEVAAELAGLPLASVRRYIRLGLVQPARTERGIPLLSAPQIARLRKIRRLRADLGLNLAGVELALRMLDEIAELRAALDRR